MDFGPDAERGHPEGAADLVHGGNDRMDPVSYTVLVPSVDRDGNDVPGVRAPMVAAPLGTYTGWNPRARGYGHGAQLAVRGQLHPVPGNAGGTRGHRRSARLDPGTLSRQGGL